MSVTPFKQVGGKAAKRKPKGGRGGEMPPVSEYEEAPCPVTALGRARGVYWFISASREVRDFSKRDLTEAGIQDLFDGDPDNWLEGRWPAVAGRGKDAVGFSVYHARRGLMRMCAEAGFFDVQNQVRGRGCWRGPKDKLIVHSGDRMLYEGAWIDAGVRIGPHVYAAAPGLMAPAETAASEADVRELLDFLHTWNWRSPIEAPRLLLGEIGAGFLAGAIAWRPHVWITGDTGEGKTILSNLLAELMGSLLMRVSAPTEALVRQLLAGDARPVSIDEIEPNGFNRRAEEVVELALLASQDGQAPTGRGSAGGIATLFPVRCAIWFSSIYHPTWLPQDVGRIAVLELDKLRATTDQSAALAKKLARFALMGPALYRRMIDGWDRMRENQAAFQYAVGKLQKGTHVIDQFGALLACAETLLSDRPIMPDEAVELLAGMDLDAVTDRQPESDPEIAFATLMSGQTDYHEEGRRMTIGELATVAYNDGSGSRAWKALASYGVKLVGIDQSGSWQSLERAPHERRSDGRMSPPWPCLAVANGHEFLKRIYSETRFRDGVWSQALIRLPSAARSGKTLDFNGAKFRAVVLCKWGRPGEDGSQEPDPAPGSVPDLA